MPLKLVPETSVGSLGGRCDPSVVLRSAFESPLDLKSTDPEVKGFIVKHTRISCGLLVEWLLKLFASQPEGFDPIPNRSVRVLFQAAVNLLIESSDNEDRAKELELMLVGYNYAWEGLKYPQVTVLRRIGEILSRSLNRGSRTGGFQLLNEVMNETRAILEMAVKDGLITDLPTALEESARKFPEQQTQETIQALLTDQGVVDSVRHLPLALDAGGKGLQEAWATASWWQLQAVRQSLQAFQVDWVIKQLDLACMGDAGERLSVMIWSTYKPQYVFAAYGENRGFAL